MAVDRAAGALLLAASAALSSCGGGSDGVSLSFEGTVSGANCFSGTPESAIVRYSLVAAGPASGSAASLTDAQGAAWQGNVGDGGSVELRQPGADERFVIRAQDVFAGGPARFEVTASCVSFRCCTTLAGTLAQR
jgi:hypothetical protein